MGGVALHQTVQTATFAQERPKNASSTWGAQIRVDEEINNKLVDLENAVLLLGKVQNLKLKIHLKGHWNITTFCVTPQEYKRSEHTWENVRRHLQGHTADNLTLDVKKLQARITGIQHASLRLLPGTDTLQGVAEGLNSLNPLGWIKGIGGVLIGTLAMFCCFTIIFCLVLRCTQKALQKLMKKEVARSTYFLPQKQKEGNAGVNSQPVALAKP